MRICIYKNGYGAFPPDTDDPLPMWCIVTNCFRMKILPNEDLPVSASQVFTDVGVPLVPPDIDRIAQINNELALMDRRISEVLGLSMASCDPLVHSNILDSRVLQGYTEWLCLLYSASLGNARDDTITIRLNGGGLDYWRGGRLGPGYCGSTMPT